MGTLSGCGSSAGKLMEQAGAVGITLAHADDAAAADRDASLANVFEGAQAVFVAPRGNDMAVKLGRSVQVVVVGGEPRGGQALGLLGGQHAQRAADFHIERRDAAAPFPAPRQNPRRRAPPATPRPCRIAWSLRSWPRAPWPELPPRPSARRAPRPSGNGRSAGSNRNPPGIRRS